MDYVIKNGTVCLEGEHFRADVTVREGKIQALGKAVHDGHETVIDADGLYVCPGGIDAHTHMDLQQSPQYCACDDFYSGGVAAPAAARRPSWTIWPLARPAVPCAIPLNGTGNWPCPARSTTASHGVIQHVDDQVLQELGQLIDEGFPSFKAYTTYGYPVGEKELMQLLPVIKKHGACLRSMPKATALPRPAGRPGTAGPAAHRPGEDAGPTWPKPQP